MFTLIRLYGYLKPWRFHFVGGFLALILSSGASLALFNYAGKLIDVESSKISGELLRILTWLGGILIIQSLASFFRIKLFAVVTENAIARLRQDAYSNLILKPMAFFSNKRVGEITSRLSSDITSIKDTLTGSLAELIREIIIILGSILIMAWTSWQLVLFMLGVLPVMAVVAVILGRRIRKLSKNAQERAAMANTIVEESLQAIASVKAYIGESYEIQRYSKENDQLIRLGIRNSLFRAVFATSVVVLLFGAIVAIIWFGARLVSLGVVTHGDLFKFFLLSVFMGASIGGLAETYGAIQKALGATESLFEMMDTPGEFSLHEVQCKVKSISIKHNIKFHKVSFKYDNSNDVWVLRNIDLCLPVGSITALVGPSGAGKTTLAGLLLRYFQPVEGYITLGEKPLTDINLRSFRSKVAVVPQDIVLFGGSVYENILYAKPDAKRQEVEEAAKLANAHEFILNLPYGYETLVGERGTQLSGGQRQRIAIARAFLKNPELLILDEATSALDSMSEQLVQEALLRLMNGRTALIIAHRLSTIRMAHQVAVLDKGRLVSVGTHEELIAEKDGLYAHLFALQLRSQEV